MQLLGGREFQRPGTAHIGYQMHTFRAQDGTQDAEQRIRPRNRKTQVVLSDQAAFQTLKNNIRSRLGTPAIKHISIRRQIKTADKIKKVSTESSQYDQEQANSILKPLLSKKQQSRPKTTSYNRPRFMTEPINMSPMRKYQETNKLTDLTPYQQQLSRVETYELMKRDSSTDTENTHLRDYHKCLTLPKAQLVQLVPLRKAPRFFKSKPNCRYTTFYSNVESSKRCRNEQKPMQLLSIRQLNKSIDERIYRIFSTFKNTVE